MPDAARAVKRQRLGRIGAQSSTTPPPLAGLLSAVCPEVAVTTRIFPLDDVVVRHGDQILAFANILEGGGKANLSIDLMRYVPEAPRGIKKRNAAAAITAPSATPASAGSQDRSVGRWARGGR